MNNTVRKNIEYLKKIGININETPYGAVEFGTDQNNVKTAKIVKDGRKTSCYSKYDAKGVMNITLSDYEVLTRNSLVVFGAGLFYEVEEIAKKWVEHSYIYVIEPSVEVFNDFVLNCDVPFESKKYEIKFLVGNNLDSNSIMEFLKTNLTYETYYPHIFITNPGYLYPFLTEYQTFIKCFFEHTTLLHSNINTSTLYAGKITLNSGNSIPEFYRCGYGSGYLEDAFAGIPAIITSTGPSLLKNIELLKEVEGKVVIIAPYVALKVLKKYDIKPTFVVTVDPLQPLTEEDEKNGYDINLVTSNMGNIELSKKNRGKSIFYGNEENTFINDYFKIDDEFNLMVLKSGGSVANNATDFARRLGCNPITVIGQNLAYENGNSHAYEDRMSQKEATLKLKGYYGDDVLTNSIFYTFKIWFEQFAAYYDDIKFLNCTEGGVYIEGFEHIPLRQMIDTYCNDLKPLDLDGALSKVKKPNEKDLTSTINKIEKELEVLRKFMELNREALKATDTLRKLNSKNMLTEKDKKKLFAVMDKFDDFYAKNLEYYDMFRLEIATAMVSQLNAYPLTYSKNDVIIEDNSKLYNDLHNAVNNAGYTLEKCLEKLKEIKEEKYGI